MKDVMDDGEVVPSDRLVLPNPDSSSRFHESVSVDSFLDELLKNTRTCTHTHTCNPPGPDASHTHTCYHTHTRVIASEDDDDDHDDNHSNKESTLSRGKRPLGNREAVRRYREKKKAHTACLEEEVKKLRVLNQQLVRRLQGQAILEAEAMRLRGLLVEMRGKIDGELRTSPFPKQCHFASLFKEGDCGFRSSNGAIGSSQGDVGRSDSLLIPMDANCRHPAVIDCRLGSNNIMSGERHGNDSIEMLVSSTTDHQ